MQNHGECHDHDPVRIPETGPDLFAEGNGSFQGLLGDPLFGEIVFHQRGGNGQDGKNTHHGDPCPLGGAADADGFDKQRHHDGHQHTGDHGGAGGGQHSQAVPLGGIPGGKGNHQAVAQGIGGKCQAEKQIVADDDPGDLNFVRSFWHGIQQNTADGQYHAGCQDPGPGFTLAGSGAVDHAADEQADDAAEQLGHQGHHGEKTACKAQNIRIELGQIGACHAGVHHVY